MNQREALLILFEATADAPETKHLRRARRWAERRMEVLRKRYARMRCARLLGQFQEHIETCLRCRTRDRCDVGRPLLEGGLLAGDEALDQPTGTLTADVA